MAEMPKGEPRSVPDPVGEMLDEASWRERFRKRHDTIMIGGKLYREYDNGQANVLMPVDDPIGRAKRADNQRAISQTLGFAQNTLGAAAYGVATLLGVSQQRRDQAFTAGATADAIIQGAAPLGAGIRGRPTTPKPQIAGPTLERPRIRYRGTNDAQQALGVDATVTGYMLGTGTKANRKLKPPGWQGDGREHNEGRGHLYGRELGGTGDHMFNIATLTQSPTNGSRMQAFEGRVARKVRNGEVVEYTVTPFYNDGILPPRAIFMTEYGSSSNPSALIIENPAGRQK